MKDLRSEKRMSKKLQKAYDKAGGFIDKEQKRQAKANLKAAVKKGKKTIRSVKRASLKNVK